MPDFIFLATQLSTVNNTHAIIIHFLLAEATLAKKMLSLVLSPRKRQRSEKRQSLDCVNL